MYNSEQGGNLSGTERAVSAGIGTGLSLLVLRSGSPILRALAGVTGLALLARAFAGHCAVKAAVTGESSIAEGMRNQWNKMSGRQSQVSDTQEAVEERAQPEALEEGFAGGEPSVSTSATAQH
jgi:DUF2892 family protein